MTRTLAVDTNNDIFVGGDGNLSIAVGIDAVMFACQQAVQTMLGEMVFAVDEGMPNFDAVWNGSPNVIQFEAYLRRTILAVPDVTNVDSVTIDATGEALVYAAVIRTIYGVGAING